MTPGCFNRSDYHATDYITAYGEVVVDRGTRICRQVGEWREALWHPLPECEGCTAEKDIPYITKARADIDAARGMNRLQAEIEHLNKLLLIHRKE